MKVCVQGKIGVHPFVQTIQLAQGEPRIDMHIKIDWMGDVQIGEPGIEFKTEDPRKSFYDDRYKLLLYFPTEIESPLIYKDAPFDVCKSRLEIHSSIVGTALNIMSLYIGSIRLPEIIRVGWLCSLTIQPAMCMGRIFLWH